MEEEEKEERENSSIECERGKEGILDREREDSSHPCVNLCVNKRWKPKESLVLDYCRRKEEQLESV